MKPRIVCGVCGKGPTEGALLRKIGPKMFICQGAKHVSCEKVKKDAQSSPEVCLLVQDRVRASR